MPRLTIEELIKKNEDDIIRQELIIEQAQEKLKKLKSKQKELLEKQNVQNQQDMLTRLKELQITNPQKLEKILEQYYAEQLQNSENAVSTDT